MGTAQDLKSVLVIMAAGRPKVRALTSHSQSRNVHKVMENEKSLHAIVTDWMNWFGRYNHSAMKKKLDCIQRRLSTRGNVQVSTLPGPSSKS